MFNMHHSFWIISPMFGDTLFQANILSFQQADSCFENVLRDRGHTSNRLFFNPEPSIWI